MTTKCLKTRLLLTKTSPPHTLFFVAGCLFSWRGGYPMTTKCLKTRLFLAKTSPPDTLFFVAGWGRLGGREWSVCHFYLAAI